MVVEKVNVVFALTVVEFALLSRSTTEVPEARPDTLPPTPNIVGPDEPPPQAVTVRAANTAIALPFMITSLSLKSRLDCSTELFL